MLPACSARCDFNEAAYTPLCWDGAGGSRCVPYLDTRSQFGDFVAETTEPIDDQDIERWDSTFEDLDGVFEFIGTQRLGKAEKADAIAFTVQEQALIDELYEAEDDEVRTVLPAVLDRNTDAELARLHVAMAPFLQLTNGSVGAANGDDIIFLLGVDRSAWSILNWDVDVTWARSVVAHESIHATHYLSSEFATSARSADPLRRKLWVEGLAMVGSALYTPRTYTLHEQLGDEYASACESGISEWAALYRADLDRRSQEDTWWASNGSPPSGIPVDDPGYCVAYFVVLSLVEEHTFEELLDLPPEEAYPLAEAALDGVIGR